MTESRALRALPLLLTLILLLGALAGCVENITRVEPSPVSVSVGQTGTEVGPPTTPAPGSVTLNPPSAEVAVGKNINVQVIVRDAAGQEVATEDLTVSIANTAVVRLVQIDGRIVQLEGVAEGQTSVIFTVAGPLQASMIVTVVP